MGSVKELALLRGLVEETIEEVMKAQKYSGNLDIPIGTMIEVPRAALTAGEIAEVADFFSFGTNDLTQMTFGFSRDDINSFLPDYLSQGVLGERSLLQPGPDRRRTVGEDGHRGGDGRRIPTLKVGICGEHGGEAESIEFFHERGVGLRELFVLPCPGGRLAAAQAALRKEGWEG